MARTFNFRVPRWNSDDCRETSRLSELTGKDLDAGYLVFMLKRAPANISRFEAEIDTPMGPGNYSLRKFAQKTLPILREEMATVARTEKKIATP